MTDSTNDLDLSEYLRLLDAEESAQASGSGNPHDGGQGHGQGPSHRRGGKPTWKKILGLLAELLVSIAAILALYVVWLLWWTGAQSDHQQLLTRESSNWSSPAQHKDLKIAEPQVGEVPVQPSKISEGELMAEMYVPRFGKQWMHNIVEGTDQKILNEHGMGHYVDTQHPGDVGNFAVAGHRNGYGQPLGDIDKFQDGDPIVVRTKDYWYIYLYQSHEIVTPEQVETIAPVPDHPEMSPSKRMITLTTCEPKYSSPTHRWIAHGELKYWAKVADGVPAELASKDASGSVQFINEGKVSPAARLGSLLPVMLVMLAAYLIIFLAAAVAWRWPRLKEIRQGLRTQPDPSFYGFIYRHQPGPALVRAILLVLLLLLVSAALLQWVYPWSTANIPFLRELSNYGTLDAS
ncbi:class E sortase [Bifidobacterium aemilianum]|uniref:Class E sortase n=1 Tax=Bifidobacterium aemilianum TaxID=2493120 RepID=A0A366K8Z8_9BIFI|nr:class E sortase [Bifidobacterium aemilianum]RBP97797.1 class E sortase [Bifidobacterium aemilianum]